MSHHDPQTPQEQYEDDRRRYSRDRGVADLNRRLALRAALRARKAFKTAITARHRRQIQRKQS